MNRLFGVPSLDHKVIESIYHHEVIDLDMGNEAYMQNPQGIANFLADGKVKYIGFRDSEYSCEGNEFAIQCWHNTVTDFHHFVAEVDGKVGYDPIEGGSRTVREGYLESKRIYQIC
jgi:hypothetical protein